MIDCVLKFFWGFMQKPLSGRCLKPIIYNTVEGLYSFSMDFICN